MFERYPGNGIYYSKPINSKWKKNKKKQKKKCIYENEVLFRKGEKVDHKTMLFLKSNMIHENKLVYGNICFVYRVVIMHVKYITRLVIWLILCWQSRFIPLISKLICVFKNADVFFLLFSSSSNIRYYGVEFNMGRKLDLNSGISCKVYVQKFIIKNQLFGL